MTWSVVALDMSEVHGTGNAGIMIGGFSSTELAREYARRRTRASVEALRKQGSNGATLRHAWVLYGEDCYVLDDTYSGGGDIAFFVDNPATADEQEWATLEPNDGGKR